MFLRLTALLDRRPQTAEAWLARLRRPNVDARDREGFQTWLEQDRDHLRQYERAKARLQALEPLAVAFQADLAALRGRRGAKGGRRIVIGAGLATAAAAAVAAFVAWPVLRGPTVGSAPRVYASAPGEIIDVVLEDGSRVTLDTDTTLQVALKPDVRRVTLTQGAAYFEVTHDAERPFQVAVADRRVIVTGTRFVTTLREGRGEVSLLEGRVVLTPQDVAEAGATRTGLPLTPGQRAEFRRGGARTRLVKTDVETASAWRQRRLVFRDAPLSTVVAEAGRYIEGPVVIADPALARLRVTVVLPLTGETPLLDRMEALLPIHVDREPDGRAVIKGG